MSKLHLFSERAEDSGFAAGVATAAGLELGCLRDPGAAIAALDTNGEDVLLVDADDERARLAFEERARHLSSDPVAVNRVHYLLDRGSLNALFQPVASLLGGSFLCRKYGGDPAGQGRLFGEMLRSRLPGFSLGTAVREVRLTNTRDKYRALEEVVRFLEDSGCHYRIRTTIETTVDELLANAIFDAPVDADGKPLHGTTPRSTLLDLKGREEVALRFGREGDLVFFSVTDLHGSLDRKTILEHVTRSFRGQKYEIDHTRANAGLGLALGFAGGASYIFACEPQRRTEVTAIYRLSPTYRGFQDRFQFVVTRVIR